MKQSMNKHFLKFFGGIFLFTGIILITVGVITLVSGMRFKESAVSVNAVISDIEKVETSNIDDKNRRYKQRIYVTYEFDGKLYEDRRLLSSSRSDYVGKELKLLVNSSDPEDIKRETELYMASIIVFCLAPVFLVIGAVAIIIDLRQGGRKKKLQQSGISIYAAISQMNMNRNIQVNGRHPYVVICSYEDPGSGKTYLFKSNSLWTDPSLVYHIGDTVKVLVDPNDYRKYVVLLDEMEKKIENYC